MDNIVKYILLQKGGNWEQDVQQKKKNKMIITDQSPFHFLADLKGKKEIKCGPLQLFKLRSLLIQIGQKHLGPNWIFKWSVSGNWWKPDPIIFSVHLAFGYFWILF